MKRQIDLFVGFTVSILLHGLIMVCVACVLPANRSEITPDFQTGDSSLALTLPFTQVSTQVDPKPMEIKTTRTDADETKSTEIIEEKNSDYLDQAYNDNNEQAIHYPDADMLKKGVVEDARPESWIRPYYPLGSRLRGEEGRVTLNVTVNTSGKARHIDIMQSSGYRALNHAAIQAVQKARFIPTRQNGIPIESEITLTFRFELVD